MENSRDPLGDQCKLYENAESGRLLMPRLPAMARIDGRAFSTFTKGLARPYDERLSKLMVATTKFLVEETGALVGYTQSDEITLVWLATRIEQQIFFNGRIQKMTSQLAALATASFNRMLRDSIPEKANLIPTFDARVWNVPNIEEVVNSFLWREKDATKNSVSMAARAYYSHARIMNKSTADMHEMLFAKGVNWNDYPSFFRRGTYVGRKVTETTFTPEEIDSLPPHHAARKDPSLKIKRRGVVDLHLPVLASIVNKAAVLLAGERPEVFKQESTPRSEKSSN